VACGAGVGDGGYYAAATGPNGASLHDHQDPVFAAVDFGLFKLIGLKPLAGRFFDPRYGEDTPAQDGSSNPSVVINESAVRALGYRTPAEAVGQIITWRRRLSAVPVGGIAAAPASGPMLPSRIVGVVPDYSTMSKTPIYTRIYYVDPKLGRTLNVKLTGRDIPETLTAIERLWTRLIDPARPARVEFIEQRLEFLYRDMRRETMTVAGFATVALFIAGLGLFGLSAFMAERRTKEIGIRKAMGASRGDILRLLLWEFTKPVLCANLFAWPVAYFFARHWLNGYANRITLDPWTFLASSAAALAIAALTVIGHAMLIARVQPNAALRYE
jgi:putative ABC transport system permease protein